MLPNSYQILQQSYCNELHGFTVSGYFEFFDGATSLDKLLKGYGSSKQIGVFPYEWFHSVEMLRHTELPNADAFHIKFKNCKVDEHDFILYNCLLGTRKGNH